MNDLLAAVSEYGTRFALWTLGVAALFALSALIPAWFCSRRGWLDIAPGGPRWLRALAVLAACLTGLTIGLVVGFQVGAIRTGVHLLRAEGPALLSRGLEQVGASLGLPPAEVKISLESVRMVLDGIEDAELDDSRGVRGAIINAAFDIVRRPFVAQADRFLSRVAPGDQVSLSGLVDATWSHVERRLQRMADALVLSAVLTGYAWLAAFAAAALLLAWVVRTRVHARPVIFP